MNPFRNFEQHAPASIPALLGAVLGIAIAVAGEPQGTACPAVVVDYTFHDYEGPTRIVSCGTWTYTGGILVVHAYDAEADGLFRNGFDPFEPET